MKILKYIAVLLGVLVLQSSSCEKNEVAEKADNKASVTTSNAPKKDDRSN